MDVKIPKNIYDNFNLDVESYQLKLLQNLHSKYLSDKIKLEKIKNEFLFKEIKKNKFTIKRKQVPDEVRCCAKIWINGKGERCNKHKKEGIDYCKIHLYKRNYGRFDNL
jgi:hypothetical protein